MRVPSLLSLALLLVAPTLTHADSILAGSDLTAINSGVGLCPMADDCLQAAQQFTMSTPFVIDEIKVVVTAPNLSPGSTDGSFNVSLGSVLGSGMAIGSGAIPISPKGGMTQEEFDFTGLNISLGAGTYFLEMTGANVQWDHAPALTTTPGSLGPSWVCDPTISCASDHWQSLQSNEAMEIDGTAITPEPSTLALFGTGFLGLAEAARRRFLKV